MNNLKPRGNPRGFNNIKGQSMSEIFKIEQEKLKVEILGDVIEFNAPSSLQEEAVQEQFRSYDSETATVHPTAIYKNFLAELGIPKEKTDQLSSKNIMALFGFAVGSKKN